MLKEIYLAGSVRPNAACQILIEAGLRRRNGNRKGP
jgi:hypothetical protein